MNSVNTIRKMVADGKEHHHKHDSGTLNSKKEKSVINKITKLCQKKNREVDVIPLKDAIGYGATLKENFDPRSQKKPFFLYKVEFESNQRGGNRFAFYSYNNSWFYTKDSNINSLVSLIKQVEGVKV